MYHEERIFQIFLYIVSPDSQVNVLQRNVLKTLTQLIKTESRINLGALGIIETMLKIIEERLQASTFL